MMTLGLGNIAFDCADIQRVATFYTALTGWPIVRADNDWVDLMSDKGLTVSFQRSPDHIAPHWPSSERSQQAHIDIDVPISDIDAENARALELGATLLDDSPKHPGFRVFADPAGHPFCLCTY